jgi:mRNA-degrading endonuclease RelE of RelBE toxin-antitoxin system
MHELITAHEKAVETLQSLSDDEARTAISDKLQEVVESEFRELPDFGTQSLEVNEEQVYRLRVGDWRVFVLRHKTVLVVLDLRKRDNAYDDLSTVEERAAEFAPSNFALGGNQQTGCLA